MQLYQSRGLQLKYRRRLKVTEIFHSLQGEGAHTGLPTTFIRLTGCALRCSYCDTSYAFFGGQWQSFEDLHSAVKQHKAPLVQITGGEPLHQKAVWPFVDELIEQGFKPMIETSGAESIAGLHPEAHIVLDIKTPESKELDRMIWENLDHLKPSDEVKFVVCSAKDLDWSINVIRERQLDSRFNVLISPVAELHAKKDLAEKLLQSGVQARFQIQLHKILWGDEVGR